MKRKNITATFGVVDVFDEHKGECTFLQQTKLLARKRNRDNSFEELVHVMKQHYNPTSSEFVQRIKLHSPFRQKGEAVSTFFSELCSLVESCNFATKVDEMLGDRTICGIKKERIQNCFLVELEMTFDKAVKVTLGMEAGTRNSQLLLGTNFSESLLSKDAGLWLKKTKWEFMNSSVIHLEH